MGLNRDNAWLCDLVPYSRMNPDQARALARSYEPLVRRLGLPRVDWNPVPEVLADDARRREIVVELRESRAEVLVTLGDSPFRVVRGGIWDEANSPRIRQGPRVVRRATRHGGRWTGDEAAAVGASAAGRGCRTTPPAVGGPPSYVAGRSSARVAPLSPRVGRVA